MIQRGRLLPWLALFALLALHAALVVPLKLRWIDQGWATSDLVTLANALYNGIQGHCFFCSDTISQDLTQPLSAFGLHFSPSTALLSPLCLLQDPSRALIWVGALAPLLTAAALYGAVYAGTGSLGWSLGCTATWLFNPVVLSTTLNRGYGFQVDNLNLGFAALALAGFYRRNAALFIGGCAAMAGVKEDYAVLVLLALAGAWALKAHLPAKPQRAALPVVVLLAGAVLLAWLHSDVSMLASSADRAGRGEGLEHLRIWAGLLLIPFWWSQALAGLGALHAGLLVELGDLSHHYFHYVPSAVIAALALPAGAMAWRQRWPRISALVLTLCVAATAFMAGGILWRYTAMLSGPPRNERPKIRASLAWLPKEAAVCASSDLLSCVSERRHLLWMSQPAAADYILLNRRAYLPPDDMLRDWTLAEAGKGRFYRLADPAPGITLFTRASPLARPLSAE